MTTPEDIDAMKFDGLLITLYKFQWYGLSFDWSYKDEMLHSVPVPPDHLNDRIQTYYDQIRHLQPGYCDECGEWWMKRVQAYWGARPLFCVPCWKRRLSTFQETNRWPEPEFEYET